MSGLDFINATPAWTLALLVIILAIGFSVGLQLFTRWRFGVDLVESNHEVAGFKFAVVGVAYGVLLAFVVLSVWDEYEQTKGSVEAEAERFYNLFRNTYNYPPKTAAKMQDALIDYAIEVRDNEWPQMQQGVRGSTSTAEAYTRLSFIVGQARPEDIRFVPSVMHSLNLLQQIADHRMERLADVGGHVTPAVWAVLLLGAFITLGYCSFFATKRVGAQILMTGGLAAIIGSIFFLMLILNYPFSGPQALSPTPIGDAIERMRAEIDNASDR